MVMSTQTTASLVKKITSSQAQENRRRLGVQLTLEGNTIQRVAQILKVNSRSVDRWISCHKTRDKQGLEAVKHPGPKSKLTQEQLREIRSWLLCDARDFDFRTNLWTSPRVVHLIKKKLRIHFNTNYLCGWISKQGFSPQMPRRKAMIAKRSF
ncbi:transposase [Telmatocola sphagniphila]|uniref:Transposase n=1 Tax=Telmatocola sphagniphila TaxID=1123043 RepID=A0A8E6B5C7_9BACT|nr:winged helix-turn-helix domain-containing protein [Telmatocola sphagniphila]QVL30798.1 transposase [Telmatocola sphagniphila]